MGAASPKDSSEAFARLILTQHGQALVRYLRHVGIPAADVDDLVQEIVHGACAARATYDPARGALLTWLIGIALKQVSHYWARAHRRHEEVWPPERFDPLRDDQPDSEVRLRARHWHKLIHELLGQLPTEQREVLIAHELLEMEIPEAARALGINENTAYSRHSAGWRNLLTIVRRYRAQQRGRGHDDNMPAVLLPLLEAVDTATRAPPPSTGWQAWLAPPSGLKSIKGVGIALALAALAPTDTARPVVEIRTPEAEAASIPTAAVTAPEPASSPAPIAPEPAPAPPPAASTVHAHRQERSRGSRSLQMEADLIQQAAVALGARRFADAQQLLEQHAREFPNGKLSPKRDALLSKLDAN